MAVKTRAELKALWANASPEYKELFDSLCDSHTNPSDDGSGGGLPYTSIIGNISQVDVDPPVIAILSNDTGLTYTVGYEATGVYYIALSASVNPAKLFMPNQIMDGLTGGKLCFVWDIEMSRIQLQTMAFNAVTGLWEYSDNVLNTATSIITGFEIRIYP